MKKLFTLFTLAAATLAASAEAPEILFGETVTEPGKTYEIGYTVESNTFPTGMTINIYTQDPDLYVRGEEGLMLTVEMTSTSPNTQLCCWGGCEVGSSVKKEDVLVGTSAGGELVVMPLEIHQQTTDMNGADPATLLQDITVTVKAYYSDSPQDAVTATVVMTNQPKSAGIGSVKADNASFSLAGNTLHYDMAAPTTLEIYTTSGALVLSRVVKAQGSLSLDSLHPGIYICRAGNKSSKLLIRK